MKFEIGTMLSGNPTANHPFLYLALIVNKTWCLLPQLTIRGLFFILVSVARLLFQELGKRAEALAAKSSKMEEAELSAKLENWRKCYEVVCRLVDAINDNFGLLISIYFILIFYNSIVKLFELLVRILYLFCTYWRYNMTEISGKWSKIYGRLQPNDHDVSNDIPNKIWNYFIELHLLMEHETVLYYYRSMLLAFQVWLRMLTISVVSHRLRIKARLSIIFIDYILFLILRLCHQLTLFCLIKGCKFVLCPTPIIFCIGQIADSLSSGKFISLTTLF